MPDLIFAAHSMPVMLTLYGKDGYQITVSGPTPSEVVERARIIWDHFAEIDYWKSARP